MGMATTGRLQIPHREDLFLFGAPKNSVNPGVFLGVPNFMEKQ